MKTCVSGGKSGVVEYLTREGKEHNKEHIKVLDGNPTLTKKIIQNMNYKENYKRIVLSFEGKPSDEKIKKAYSDWKSLYMDSTYKKEEYNILSVLHKDTDNYHIHITIPNKNLITDTRLDSYVDKKDRNRMNEIRDYINLKNGWQKQDLTKKKSNEPIKTKEEIINTWREQHNQKVKPIVKQKQRAQALTKLVNNVVMNSIKDGKIENIKDVKNLVNDLGNYEFIKQGEDTISNFSYITIQDKETQKKYRIKSDVYKKDFDYNEENYELNLLDDKDIFQKITPKKYKLSTQKIEKELPKRLEKIAKMNEGAKARISNNTSKKSKDKLNEYYTNNRKIENTNTREQSTGIKEFGDTIKQDTTRQEQSNKLLSSRVDEFKSELGELKKGVGIMKENKTETFKKDINLVEYASNFGFEIDKKKSGKYEVVMKNENDTISITKKPNDHYVFNSFESQKGGTIIDFYKEYVNDKKVYWQQLNDLEKYHKNPKSDIKYTMSKATGEVYAAQQEWSNYRDIKLDNSYLTQERKIDPTTLEIFKDTIKQDTKNNICFIHKNYEIDENYMKIDTCGIERKNSNFKGHTGKKGLWGKDIGDSNEIFLFESPLDAMSYYELNKKDGMYVSLGGSPSEKQLKDLEQIVKYTKRNITTMFDNDTHKEKNKGQELSNKIKQFLSQLITSNHH